MLIISVYKTNNTMIITNVKKDKIYKPIFSAYQSHEVE